MSIDLERTICPSTLNPCHTLMSCRLTSCMYGHGGLKLPPKQREDEIRRAT
jgi:hypothetical protein